MVNITEMGMTSLLQEPQCYMTQQNLVASIVNVFDNLLHGNIFVMEITVCMFENPYRILSGRKKCDIGF